MAARWSLFVDESGRFAGGDPSVVAGIVVEGGPEDGGRLRSLLADIWGPGPYPPHASHLRLPASRVLYALPGARRDMPAGRFHARDAVRELTPVLRESAMAARVARIEDGEFPTFDDCARADDALRGHPAWKVLEKARDDQDRAMGTLVAQICARANGFVVATLADRDRGEAPPPARLALREDAYVRALGVMAERLARVAGAHDVECFVLTREVEVGGLGRIDMQGRFLAPLLERAAAETRSPARLRPGGATFHYRDHTKKGVPLHPLFVVADWVASGLRRAVLGRRASGLGSLEAAIEADLVPRRDLLRRTPARAAGLGPLPTFAAAGAPEEAIRAAFAPGNHRPAGEPEGPAWTWDQARAWIDAAGRWP